MRRSQRVHSLQLSCHSEFEGANLHFSKPETHRLTENFVDLLYFVDQNVFVDFVVDSVRLTGSTDPII